MLKTYLAGPIEYQDDAGQNWREEITPRLFKLGIESIDPTRELTGKRRLIKKELDELQQYKKDQDWPNFYKLMQQIWLADKAAVDEADFLIVHLRDSDNLSGTIREMQEAYEYGKPIFLVIDGDVSKVKSHTLHMALRKGKIFQDFDELIDHLKLSVNQAEKKLSGHPLDLYQVTQKLLVVNDQNQLLVLTPVVHPHWYGFPGGRLDIQEFEVDLKECMHREIKEELGDDVKLDISYQPFEIGRIRLWNKVIKASSYRKVLVIYYEAKYLGGEIKLSDEHSEYKWVDIKTFDPTDKFKPGMVKVVEEWLERKRE